MNYEKLWNERKRALIDMILAGKKESCKDFDSRAYEIITKGDKAMDDLFEVALAEVNQYDEEHTTHAFVKSEYISTTGEVSDGTVSD